MEGLVVYLSIILTGIIPDSIIFTQFRMNDENAYNCICGNNGLCLLLRQEGK